MTTIETTCPIDDEQLWDLVDGTSDGTVDRADVERHAEQCTRCRARLAEIRRLHAGLESLGRSGPRSAPESVGSYRIVRPIGEGGMGIVYEAEQPEPRRRVALKVLRPVTADDQRRIRAFRREVRALARLDHPDIARIHDAGQTADGQFFFAMQLVDGVPLDRHCSRRELTVRERAALVGRVARAVHHAHQKGVVHRDLKPANVLVDGSGAPHVLDFGLARLSCAPGQQTRSLTVVGMAGTLPYMSPEQLAGDRDSIDVRVDVWALGVMIYELLAGRLPHDPDLRIDDAVRAICECDASHPSAVCRDVPAELGDVVMRALERDPERRYASAEAFAQDIERFLSGEAVSARPISFGYRLRVLARRHKVAAAGLLAVVVALGLGLFVASVAWSESRAQRRDADLATSLLHDALRRVDPFLGSGQGATVRQLLDDLSARLKSADLFPADSLREADLRATIGGTYINLLDPERAATHLRVASAIRSRVLGRWHASTVASRYLLARATGGAGAASIYEDVVRGYRSGHVAADANVAGCLAGLGQRTPGPQGHALLEESLAVYRALGASGADPAIVSCLRRLVAVADARGEVAARTRRADELGAFQRAIRDARRGAKGRGDRTIRTQDPPFDHDHFGESVAILGDLDADGHAEVAAVSRIGVVVCSGRSGRVLRVLVGSPGYDNRVVAAAGDVDADGVPDVVIGKTGSFSPPAAGEARVYSGRTFAEIAAFVGDADGAHYGFGLAGVGDVDRDGHDDVAIFAAGHGYVHVRSGRTGEVLWTFRGVDEHTELRSVSGSGDDASTDVVVGAKGRVFVLAGHSGEVRLEIPGDTDWFGEAVGVGDVDGDSVADVAVRERARSWVFSGRDGAVLANFDAGFLLGETTAVGDLTGDGHPEIAFGAPDHRKHGPGLVQVADVAKHRILFTVEGDSVGDLFGFAVAGGGDVNGDGVPDLLVGASQPHSPLPGYVRVISGASLLLSAEPGFASVFGGGSQTLHVHAGAAYAQRGYRIVTRVEDGPTTSVDGPGTTMAEGVLDARGEATAVFRVPSVAPHLMTGTTFRHVCVLTDARGNRAVSAPVFLELVR